jgi:uncharacterized protein (TIGR00375 family)
MRKVVADLHLHSKYSRAVSQQMMPESMSRWAVKKGIDLLATSDWTHPLWLKELEASLTESEKGIYKFKSKESNLSRVNFVLSTEISSIYSQGGQTRRIHNLVLVPSFTAAAKINTELKRRGCNLMSDGRPIIGLSSIELAELVWTIDDQALIIPAHIWTPWFSMYGSKSGFDSLKECWGQFADRIYAVETGLSSDPAMNWRIKDLDKRTIISNSDAHSPAKIGRETVVFAAKSNIVNSFNYQDLVGALKNNKQANYKISYTIEFYPEEGKYHYSGHRKCKVRHSIIDTHKKGTTCPVCGKPLTLGVMHRVDELAARDEINPVKKKNKAGLVGYYNPVDENRPPYIMLVPLLEIISESLNVGSTSKTVETEYENMIKNLGSELQILTQTNIEKIARLSGKKIAEGIKKVRSGDIMVEPGFDGLFGVVKIWNNEKMDTQTAKVDKKEQMSFF